MMLSREDAFAAWAPESAAWSDWAKPIVFAHGEMSFEPRAVPDEKIPALPIFFDPTCAVVADLPGADAVFAGLALAKLGWQPVPLFNATRGPMPAVDVEPIATAMANSVERLKWVKLSPDAPPAFLIDSLRFGKGVTPPVGSYDNRWVVLPQDFPSGALLASRGIKSATVLLRSGMSIGTTFLRYGTQVSTDLTHVLRRWQEHGIRIDIIEIDTRKIETNVSIPAPSRFRRAWYVVMALLGLRRSNVGGFGSIVPEQGGGGYG